MPGITGDQMDTLNAIAIQMFEMPFDQLPSEAQKDVMELAQQEIGLAGGGLASISQMTRPIHMNNGGETKTATASGMHPLVEWKEIYDSWIIDGGEPMPMWDFIEMMTKGIKKG